MSDTFVNENDSYADDMFADEIVPVENTSQQKKSGGNGCMIAGIGCGVVALILVVAVAYGVWWVKKNARQFGTDLAVNAMKSSLEDLDIPDDQRTRIDARIDEVGQLFKDGDLTIEQVGGIAEKLAASPLLSAGMALYFERAYLRESGLTDGEKDAAEITARRFIRGSIDKTIDQKTVDSVLDEVSSVNEDGEREFRETLTDDELRTFVAAMKQAADDASVPDDVPEINVADEFDIIVDDALRDAGVTTEDASAELPAEADDAESAPSAESETPPADETPAEAETDA